MNWLERYEKPKSTDWKGRDDCQQKGRLFQKIQLWDLEDVPKSSFLSKSMAFLGYACDEGVRRNLGRTGASEAPFQIRSFLGSLPIHTADAFELFDCGNVLGNQIPLAESQKHLSECVFRMASKGCLPILVGGGHEMAWGTMQGLMQTYPGESIGIINIDAHLDIRPLLEDGEGSSGTGFLQMAQAFEEQSLALDYLCLGAQRSGNSSSLFSTAQEKGIQYVLAEDFHWNQGQEAMKKTKEWISRKERLYVTICLDAFASSHAPGVSAPQIMGLLPPSIVPIVRELATSGKVVALDFAELNPSLDRDNQTAKLLATLFFEWFHAFVEPS